MNEQGDWLNEVVWENYVPEQHNNVGFRIDKDNKMLITDLVEDDDCFSPFILLHFLHITEAKDKSIDLKVDIRADRETLLGLRLHDYSWSKSHTDELNKLISKAGSELFDQIIGLDNHFDKSDGLYNFVTFCRGFTEENYKQGDSVMDTRLLSTLYEYSNAKNEKIVSIKPSARFFKGGRQANWLGSKTPVDISDSVSDFDLFSDDDLFEESSGEHVLVSCSSAEPFDMDNTEDKVDGESSISPKLSDITIPENLANDKSVIDIIRNEHGDSLSLEEIASKGDLTACSFVEKLRLIYKSPKIKGKSVDETILWAAIVSSPDMRRVISSVTDTQGDIIPTSDVTELLKIVNSQIDNRLYGSGDQDGKSWFEWELPDVKTLRVTHDVRGKLSFIFKLENDKFAIDRYRLCKLLKLALHFDGLPVTREILKRTDIGRLQLSECCATIRQTLDEEIFGQNEAKDALISAWRATRTGIEPTRRGPVFFYGASGVGKTSLATEFVKALNHHSVCNGAYELQVINLEMLTNKNDLLNLLGSSHIYNVASLGTLTTPNEFLPNRVIVFDEVEKAHHSVIQGLLSIISSRECLDRTTRRQISFENCIFVFTSNIGAKQAAEDINSSHLSVLSEGGLSPEFINRLQQGHIARCRPLSIDNKAQVIEKIARETEQKLQVKFNRFLPHALAMMAGDLNPRKLIGQKSQLMSLISAEEDKHILSARLTQYETVVTCIPPKGHEDLNELVAKMGSRKWQTAFDVVSKLDGNEILITLIFAKPRLEYETSHINCPFITFIENSKSRFENIIGNDKAVKRLTEKTEEMNKGLVSGDVGQIENTLLYGPPGSGKTELAAAIACEFDGPFIKVDSANLTVGDFERNVRYLFDVCHHYAPCIVFLDEFDAIARKREGESAGVTLMTTALLTAIDGMQRNQGVWVIGATNHPDSIDEALLREGRFGEKINIRFPAQKDVEHYITRFLKNAQFNLDDDSCISQLGVLFASSSVGHINSIITNAVKHSECTESFYRACVSASLDKHLGRPVADSELSHDSCTITSYHEAGHAVVVGLLYDFANIVVIDTHPRSKSCGVVQRKSHNRNTQVTKRFIKNDIQIALAGRAAELILAGDEEGLTVGACRDLTDATELAYNAITRQGFSDNKSLIDTRYFGTSEHKIQQEANEWLLQAHQQVTELLKQNWHLLEALVNALKSRKTLLTKDVLHVIEQAQTHPQTQNIELH